MGCNESKKDNKNDTNGKADEESEEYNGENHVEPSLTGGNQVKDVELDKDEVQEYFRIEKQTRKLEKQNVIKKYETRLSHAEELKKAVVKYEAEQKELVKLTEKEKADVENLEIDTVKEYLKSQGKYDTQYDKEQSEYLDALNKQEVNTKELENARLQYDQAMEVANKHKVEADKLNGFYAQQDEFLTRIFGGEYGSDLENSLESKLDDLLEWQQRVSLARFKWTNARVLLVHAQAQMGFGVKRWQEVGSIDEDNARMRYFAAAEARNNFMAASQNIQSARMYINKVDFPYCTPEEMESLDATIGNAFTDVQESSRYEEASNMYRTVNKKIAALIQWFDQVIKDTIMKDHHDSNAEVRRLQKDLRAERIRLIKELMEKQGIVVDVGEDDDDEEDLEDDDEDELVALSADQVDDDDDLPGEKLRLASAASRHPTPLPDGQIADPPTEEELFGNISQLRTEHDKRRQGLDRQTRAAKAKMDDNLKRKLSERRTRQQRAMSVVMDNMPGVE